VLGRIQGCEGQLVLFLVDFAEGRILESSVNLTEAEAREVLAENYGQSKSQIEARLKLAKTHRQI
jgi:hypothetical protein